ncbi:hypothetical protein BH11BAC3_BH11BAC3_12340 [soil metagenome]
MIEPRPKGRGNASADKSHRVLIESIMSITHFNAARSLDSI